MGVARSGLWALATTQLRLAPNKPWYSVYQSRENEKLSLLWRKKR